MHDKKAETNERVAWTETGNMYTEDIFKAAKVMAWTDIDAQQLKIQNGGSMAGRKTETGSVYHYSLSWAHRETPSEEHQREMAYATLERLGLSENQYYLVGHNDTDHSHVHIVANLTHPETGKRTHIGLDRKALQAWALEYEKEHGIYCANRVLNAQLREKDGARYYTETQKARHGIKVTRAYNASDDGKSFKNAMEQEGLELARGRRFLLAVDSKGNMVNIAKVIEGHTTRDMKKKFADIDRKALPDVDNLAERIKKENQPFDRDAAEVARHKKFDDAANAAAAKKVQLEDAQAEAKTEAKKAMDAKNKRIVEAAKAKKYTDYFDNRINEAKERHDIKGSRERLEDAKDVYSKVHGVNARLFKREQFEEAHDNLQNREKQLANQMERFKADIEGIYQNRQWAIEKELEKQEFDEKEIAEYKARYAEHKEQEKDVNNTIRQTIKTIDERKKQTEQKSKKLDEVENITEKFNANQQVDETKEQVREHAKTTAEKEAEDREKEVEENSDLERDFNHVTPENETSNERILRQMEEQEQEEKEQGNDHENPFEREQDDEREWER